MSGQGKKRHSSIHVNQTQHPHPHCARCFCYHSQITPSLLSSLPSLFSSRSFRAQHTNEQGTAPLRSSSPGVVTFFSSPLLYTVLPLAALLRPTSRILLGCISILFLCTPLLADHELSDHGSGLFRVLGQHDIDIAVHFYHDLCLYTEAFILPLYRVECCKCSTLCF